MDQPTPMQKTKTKTKTKKPTLRQITKRKSLGAQSKEGTVSELWAGDELSDPGWPSEVSEGAPHRGVLMQEGARASRPHAS